MMNEHLKINEQEDVWTCHLPSTVRTTEATITITDLWSPAFHSPVGTWDNLLPGTGDLAQRSLIGLFPTAIFTAAIHPVILLYYVVLSDEMKIS
jgi:hypothetical protein